MTPGHLPYLSSGLLVTGVKAPVFSWVEMPSTKGPCPGGWRGLKSEPCPPTLAPWYWPHVLEGRDTFPPFVSVTHKGSGSSRGDHTHQKQAPFPWFIQKCQMGDSPAHCTLYPLLLSDGSPRLTLLCTAGFCLATIMRPLHLWIWKKQRSTLHHRTGAPFLLASWLQAGRINPLSLGSSLIKWGLARPAVLAFSGLLWGSKVIT